MKRTIFVLLMTLVMTSGCSVTGVADFSISLPKSDTPIMYLDGRFGTYASDTKETWGEFEARALPGGVGPSVKGDIYSAAYWQSASLLVTISAIPEVRSFHWVSDRWEALRTRSWTQFYRPRNSGFTSVPGLLYFVGSTEAVLTGAQRKTWETVRASMAPESDPWYRAEYGWVSESVECGAFYRRISRGVQISTVEGRVVTLRTDAVTEDSDDELPFVLAVGEFGFLARHAKSWQLFDVSGQPVGEFDFPYGYHPDNPPRVEGGRLIVDYGSRMRGTYEFDIESGTLNLIQSMR